MSPVLTEQGRKMGNTKQLSYRDREDTRTDDGFRIETGTYYDLL